MYFECDSKNWVTLTKFKREEPEKYYRYRDRIQKVEDFHRQDADNRKEFAKSLTEEEFFKTEEFYNSMCALTGREPTDMTE